MAATATNQLAGTAASGTGGSYPISFTASNGIGSNAVQSFTVAVNEAPVLFEPGTRYQYSNPGMAALSYAITVALKGGDIRSTLKERVLDPLGLPERHWSIGYGRAYEVDGLKLYAMS